MSVDEGRRGVEDAKMRDAIESTMPIGAAVPTDDYEVTRTAVADVSESVRTDHHEPSSSSLVGAARVIAPLQYRDPDRYEVLGEHGRGGIGRVQRAHDKELDRSVAIKELIKRGDMGEVRFLREAMITARLEHPGIVPIHEAGRWPDGTPFYVMKLVAGRSLKELIEERGTIEERLSLLHHVIAVADAVAYAHERGIIHRDLKPGNVIAGDFGETVVIDWGLAKDLRSTDDAPLDDGPYRTAAGGDLTMAGSVLGTPLYMSPEQARGERVDQRADVYAIGAMLWQLCSLACVSPTGVSECERVLRASSIDPDLVAIITKALQQDPAHRYRDAGALAADLKAFKSGARIAARDYSFVGLLAHWIRRRRMVAITAAVVATIALAGSVLYVRNIASERDRADAAARHADAERAIAASERDRARLAEAGALLEKDPTRAQSVLAALTSHTLEYALLRSRANAGAAVRVLRVRDGIARLLVQPVTGDVALVSQLGDLSMVDVEGGELRLVDRMVQDAITHERTGWLYARKEPAENGATLASTTGAATLDLGELLIANESTLLHANGRRYALDRGVLYVLDPAGPVVVRSGVRSIAGNEHVLMVCSSSGELEVTRNGSVEMRSRCAKNPSLNAMAATDDDYAALLDPETVLLARQGKVLRVPAHVTGEYALALASSGLFGLADFNGKPWFVRANGQRLELGPPHAARVVGVAVDGDIAAWSFEDGVVIAVDVRTGQSWSFLGHGAPVYQLAVDARRARLISVSRDELRVWALAPSPAQLIERLPCLAFNAVPSADGTRIALDCDDGFVREWSLATEALRVLHQHEGIAHGVTWLGDAACSGGWDGRLLCTAGGVTRELRLAGSRVRRIVKMPHRDELVVATDDGAVRTSAGDDLYRHPSTPYAIAVSADGQRVASGGSDGSIVLYDTSAHRIRSTTTGHSGLILTVAWQGDELWSAGMDGVIKRWREHAGTMLAVETIREEGAARFFHLFADGWTAAIGARTLVVHRGRTELRLDLGQRVVRLEVSDDDRYIGAATSTEVVILDLRERRVATLPLPSNGGYIGFTRPGHLTISNASGLITVPLSPLPYVAYESVSQLQH